LPCEVCSHPRALAVMSEVFKGTMTYIEAAKKLDLPADAVWKCFANHWQIQTKDNEVILQLRKAEDMDDYVTILNELMPKFIEKLNTIIGMDNSPSTVNSMTKLSSECRGLMRDILEFQGKIGQSPLIQLNVLQVQMMQLTNWLINNLNPEDARRLMKALPELMKVEQPEAIGVRP